MLRAGGESGIGSGKMDPFDGFDCPQLFTNIDNTYSSSARAADDAWFEKPHAAHESRAPLRGAKEDRKPVVKGTAPKQPKKAKKRVSDDDLRAVLQQANNARRQRARDETDKRLQAGQQKRRRSGEHQHSKHEDERRKERNRNRNETNAKDAGVKSGGAPSAPSASAASRRVAQRNDKAHTAAAEAAARFEGASRLAQLARPKAPKAAKLPTLKGKSSTRRSCVAGQQAGEAAIRAIIATPAVRAKVMRLLVAAKKAGQVRAVLADPDVGPVARALISADAEELARNEEAGDANPVPASVFLGAKEAVSGASDETNAAMHSKARELMTAARRIGKLDELMQDERIGPILRQVAA